MKNRNGFYPTSNGYLHKFTYKSKRYSVACKTIEEGKEKEAEIIEKIKNRVNLDKEKMSLNQYYDLYELRRREAGKIAESTIWNDRTRYDTYIKPCLGRKRVAAIDLSDIEEMRRKWQNKLSTQTCNGVMDVLDKVMRQATVRDRIIPYNPCDGLERLKRMEPPTKDTIHRALTDDELDKLFDQLDGSYYRTLFLFLLETGLRCSEALALKWGDVDEFTNCFHVTKTVSRTDQNTYVISKPKTACGIRDIPLSPKTRAILKKQRAILITLNGGAIPITSSLVFPNTKGEMNCESNANAVLKHAVKRAGIGHIGTHAFRDTYATKAAYSGVPRNTLAYLMGHSNPAITDKYYISVPNQEKRNAVELVQFAVSV